MTQGWAKIRQAAAYSGVSVRTLRTWLTMGLKHARVRGCILMRYSDIDAFIERFVLDENVAGVVDSVLRSMKK